MSLNNLSERAFGLADCNNFFVSCERRADNSLDNRPVVVLSCNDGCVISRSNEVKKMGVKMGEPYFKIKNVLAYNGVAVRSTNMTLYQQVSAEVMNRIKLYSDATEMYSIDESFFNLAIHNIKDPESYCMQMRRDIWLKCRIPVSIGIAPTKTLAKLATEYAKKDKDIDGVFWISRRRYSDMTFMSLFSCGDVWGLGRQTCNKLALYRVRSAADFVKKDDAWLKNNFGVNIMYCAWELRGHSAYSIVSDRKPPKSVMVSRSFGTALKTMEEVLDPLLCFAVSAARQLRKSAQAAGKISVFISTSRFDTENYYSNSRDIYFSDPQFLDTAFMQAAKRALEEIFICGYDYKKCGVILSDLHETSCGIQTSLFAENDVRKAAAARAIDSINRESSSSIMKPALLFSPPHEEKKWSPHSEFSSQRNKKNSPLPDGLRFQCHADDFAD